MRGLSAPSFRLKIALLSAGLSATVLLTFGVFFLAIIHRLGMARIDREILALGESQLKARPDRDAGRDLEDSLRFLYGPESPQRLVLRVRGAFGDTLYQSPDWPTHFDQISFPEPQLPRLRLPGPRPRERPPFPRDPPPAGRLGDLQDLKPGRPGVPPPIRSAFATVPDGTTRWRLGVMSHPRAEVVLAQDLAAFDAENARTRNTFLLVAPAALLLLAAAGFWVSGQALKPVEAITRTAARITARGLGERVPAVRADRELAELTQVINDMLSRLERSFSQAARFSADAAHELKTPLTILQGQLEQAIQEAEDGSAIQRTLGDLLGEVQRLRSIVRKLLLLAQADAGELGSNLLRGGMEMLDWSGRVEELAADLRELAPELAITASIAPQVRVRGDADLLVQLLQNLGTNAIKFNQGQPGSIELELTQQEGRTRLGIANTGPPLSEEEKARLFERFFRADPARGRRVEGVGLGLSLARDIALAHGGDLKVDTDRPGWVRFTLELGAA